MHVNCDIYETPSEMLQLAEELRGLKKDLNSSEKALVLDRAAAVLEETAEDAGCEQKECQDSKRSLLAEQSVWALGMTGDMLLKEAGEISASSEEDLFLDRLFQEMESDCDADEAAVIRMYQMATPEERSIMDALMVHLCGWSFGTIIRMALKDREE